MFRLVENRWPDGFEGHGIAEPIRHLNCIVDRGRHVRSRCGDAGRGDERIGLNRRQPAAAAVQHTLDHQAREGGLHVRQRGNYSDWPPSPLAIGGHAAHRDRGRLGKGEAGNLRQRRRRIFAAHEDSR